jgi:predicted short-subunit dehydrogenase-like oxidoreductase (DUF2520 family)
MLPAMAIKIAIVGAGRLAAALAPALERSGYSVTEIISRSIPASLRKAQKLARSTGAHAVSVENAALDADLIWFCVPDGEIRNAARVLAKSADWKGKMAIHSSGALASDELDVLREGGAAVASVHPLMTFVSGSQPGLKGVPFALEGDRPAITFGRNIVRRLGGKPFAIRKQDKVLYHAWGTFASPLLIALLATSEQVARRSGIPTREARKKMLPILRQTLANYAALGPAKAFSGPLVRGDAEVLRRHLVALKKVPQAGNVYLALARSGLRYLPAQRREKSLAVLER